MNRQEMKIKAQDQCPNLPAQSPNQTTITNLSKAPPKVSHRSTQIQALNICQNQMKAPKSSRNPISDLKSTNKESSTKSRNTPVHAQNPKSDGESTETGHKPNITAARDDNESRPANESEDDTRPKEEGDEN